MKLRTRVWGMALVLTMGWAAGAGDWTQWRGPNGDNISSETGLLQEWPAGGPELAWKASGLGGGYSSVSVSQGRVYTMGDIEGAAQIVALDLKDGATIWKARLGEAGGGAG